MEVGARSQGYTFAAALDDKLACRQSVAPDRSVEGEGPGAWYPDRRGGGPSSGVLQYCAGSRPGDILTKRHEDADVVPLTRIDTAAYGRKRRGR